MSLDPSPSALVKRRTKALRAALPVALEGDITALHRARVASRRLRELLPLLALPGAKPGKTRKRVRRLTQLLGRVREMDVALQLLDSLGEGVPRLALFEARQHVRNGRESRRGQMLRKLHKLSVKKLDRRLDALVTAAEGQDATTWRRRLATQLTRRAGRLRDAAAEAGAIYVPERLHGVRLAAKKLRYALEIAAELGVRDAAKLAAVVRRSQVTLGHLQDRHVLVREVHDAASRAVDDAARNGLLTIAAQLDQSARELHAEFLAQREALLAAVAAVRQDVVAELARTGRAGRQLRAGLKTRAGRGRPRLKAGA